MYRRWVVASIACTVFQVCRVTIVRMYYCLITMHCFDAPILS